MATEPKVQYLEDTEGRKYAWLPPKTAQEWTVAELDFGFWGLYRAPHDLISRDFHDKASAQTVADAINAALADACKAQADETRRCIEMVGGIAWARSKFDEYERQLAAERAKADDRVFCHVEEIERVKRGKQSLRNEIAQLREQLAVAVEALEIAKRHLEATTQALGEFTTSDDVVVLDRIDAALEKVGK